MRRGPEAPTEKREKGADDGQRLGPRPTEQRPSEIHLGFVPWPTRTILILVVSLGGVVLVVRVKRGVGVGDVLQPDQDKRGSRSAAV